MTEEKKLVEVMDINPINKGALLATCSVRIIPWKLTLLEIKIFQKGENRWITMPSKEYTNKDGEKKSFELIKFDMSSAKASFQKQIMTAIDEFLLQNPEMEPAPIITDEETPF